MKKGLFLLFLVLMLSGVGCVGTFSTPSAPSPVPMPTATPTPNLTPVCGISPVTMPVGLFSLANSGIHVIQNTAQWNQFCQPGGNIIYLTPVPTPTPPPAPVNFANQMIITSGDPQPCDNTTTTITNVCVGPSQVTVYVTSDTCVSCPQCNVASMYTFLSSVVAVPQSNLPVSVVYTYTSH